MIVGLGGMYIGGFLVGRGSWVFGFTLCCMLLEGVIGLCCILLVGREGIIVVMRDFKVFGFVEKININKFIVYICFISYCVKFDCFIGYIY